MAWGRYKGDDVGGATGNLVKGSVLEFSSLPSVGNQIGDIFIVETTTGTRFIDRKKSGLWRWDGANWVRLSDTTNYLRVGDNVSQLINDSNFITLATAQAIVDTHASDLNNPHQVTKAQVGLDQVDNTSDLDKPISTAVQSELNSINAELDMLFDWTYYATQWDTPPVLNKAIAGGDVYTYVLNSVTRYRFVPSTYDATQDCFYENFDSGTDTLSNPIICRGF